MSLKPKTEADTIFLHQKLLDQIARTYDNPELGRIIKAAKAGQWDQAFYDRFKPTLGEKSVDTKTAKS